MIRTVRIFLILFFLSFAVRGQNGSDSVAQPFFNQVALRHFYHTYKIPYIQHWHLSSLELRGENNHMALLGKINYGQRLNSQQGFFRDLNMQYQLDAYPIINDRNYFYLSYAYSASPLFPKHQTRAVYYHIFNPGIEASVGMYLMQWETSFPIFTGSLGKYLKHYWISLRPYLVYRKQRLTQSYILFIRRYLGSPEDFLTLMLGYGASPVEPVYLVDLNKPYEGKSIHFQFNYQRKLGHWLARAGAGLRYEEFKKNTARYRHMIEMGLSYNF